MKYFTLLLMLLVFSFSAYADESSEKENLAKLIKELDYFIKRVDEISADAPKTEPYFRYDLLSQDMKTIRAGVKAYFNKSLTVARHIKPIKANYIDNKDGK